MDFNEWLGDYKVDVKNENAVVYLLNWLKRKKLKFPDLDLQEVTLAAASLTTHRKVWVEFLKKKKAVKAIKVCFESAWTEYVRDLWAQREESIGKDGHAKPTVLRVQKSFKGLNERGESEDEDIIDVRTFQSESANVGFDMSISKDMGDGWVKFGVSLRMPCYPEEVEDVYKLLEKFSSVRINNEFKRIMGREDDLEEEPSLMARATDESLLP